MHLSFKENQSLPFCQTAFNVRVSPVDMCVVVTGWGALGGVNIFGLPEGRLTVIMDLKVTGESPVKLKSLI